MIVLPPVHDAQLLPDGGLEVLEKLASVRVAMRSPCSFDEHPPLMASQKFSRLAPLSVAPVPRKFLGLPIGTGFTYSAVEARVMSTFEVNGLLKNWSADASEISTWSRELAPEIWSTFTVIPLPSENPLSAATCSATVAARP